MDETESITPAEQRAIDAYLQVLRAGGPRIKAIRALIELEASSPGSAVRVLEKVTR